MNDRLIKDGIIRDIRTLFELLLWLLKMMIIILSQKD